MLPVHKKWFLQSRLDVFTDLAYLYVFFKRSSSETEMAICSFSIYPFCVLTTFENYMSLYLEEVLKKKELSAEDFDINYWTLPCKTLMNF